MIFFNTVNLSKEHFLGKTMNQISPHPTVPYMLKPFAEPEQVKKVL